MVKRKVFGLLLLVFISIFGLALLAQDTPQSEGIAVEVTNGTTCTFSGTSGGQSVINPETDADNDGEISHQMNYDAGTAVTMICGDGTTGTYNIVPKPTQPPSLTPACPAGSHNDSSGNCVSDCVGCPTPPTFTPGPNIGTICSSNNAVRIRSGPTNANDDNIVGYTAAGQLYTYIAQAPDAEGEGTWYQIAGGWIAGFAGGITVDAPCTAAPETSPSPTTIPQCPDTGQLPPVVQEGFSDLPVEERCEQLRAILKTLTSLPRSPMAPIVHSRMFECLDVEAWVSFTDLLGSLDPNGDTLTKLNAHLSTLTPDERCDFVKNLIENSDISTLPGNFSITDTAEILALTCEPHLSQNLLELVVESVPEEFTRGQLMAGENPCLTVETYAFLGGLADQTNQYTILYNALLDECSLPSDEAITLVAYAVVIVNVSQLMDEAHGDLSFICQEAPTYFDTYQGDFSPEEQSLINTISNALASCRYSEAEKVVLTMFTWKRWYEMPESQMNLLLQINPCQSIRDFVDSGVFPKRPVNGEIITVTPLPPAPTVPTPSAPPINEPSEIREATSGMGLGRYSYSGPQDVIAIFLGQDGNRRMTLQSVDRGDLKALPLAEILYRDDFAAPVVNQAGQQLIYFADGAKELRLIDLDPTKSPTDELFWRTILSDSMVQLIKPGFVIASYPMAWLSDDNYLFVTLLDTNNNNRGSIYKFNMANDQLELFVDNAVAPSLSPDGRFVSYTVGDAGQRKVGYKAVQGVRTEVFANPPGTQECFAPAFESLSPDSYLSVIFICRQEEEIGFYRRNALLGKTVQIQVDFEKIGIQVGGITTLVPGPSYGYLAFDDGQTIYFGYINSADPSRPTILSPSAIIKGTGGLKAFSLRWSATTP